MKNAVVRITKHRRETLEDTRDEAPLHNGPMLDLVTYLQKHYPDLPIYGVSDSYFHHTIPQWRRLSGITFKEKTYLQHGYHGLSLASSVKQLKKQCSAHKTLFPKRIIIAHLGSGSSITGLLHGKSMITSMGYTPLDGICMATRPGHVDSGIILSMIHEMIEGKEDSEEIYQHLDTQLHQKSGLLALAGTKDMKYIVDHRAKEPYTSTLNHYCDQCIEMIGGYATVLGGVDMLVFSGGIGEHSSYIRKRIIKGIKKIFPAIKTRVIIIDEEQEMYDELCIANHKKK